MVRTELTEEEAKVVEEILTNYVDSLVTEIYGRDALSFKKTEELVHKREIAAEIVERLKKSA